MIHFVSVGCSKYLISFWRRSCTLGLSSPGTLGLLNEWFLTMSLASWILDISLRAHSGIGDEIDWASFLTFPSSFGNTSSARACAQARSAQHGPSSELACNVNLNTGCKDLMSPKRACKVWYSLVANGGSSLSYSQDSSIGRLTTSLNRLSFDVVAILLSRRASSFL